MGDREDVGDGNDVWNRENLRTLGTMAMFEASENVKDMKI